MINIIEKGLVPYSKATEIAKIYKKTTDEIERLLQRLGSELQELKAAFQNESFGSNFDIEIQHRGNRYNVGEADGLLYEFRRQAWACLFQKLDIGKCMTVKRQEEMREKLFYGSPRRNEKKDLPEITPETIMSVMSGFIHSADEFLEEKIREVFDWLVPRNRSEYKTNKRGQVGRKVIRTFCVQQGYSHGWQCETYSKARLTALDSVFSFLDGAGIPKEHDGELVTAINGLGDDGKGETKYFRLKCYKNGNLHIEFIKLDLLKEFNRRAGGSAIADQ